MHTNSIPNPYPPHLARTHARTHIHITYARIHISIHISRPCFRDTAPHHCNAPHRTISSHPSSYVPYTHFCIMTRVSCYLCR
ncbi:hypothetical protein BDZ97DRAFT_1785615 [Flammula alnicola]|nr:hypothetical protein BDZ97DRAFT_1785615 [Flammula alnicola]